jgi:hypothetical protein
MDRLVLKGGNALDLILHAASRASVDIDLSMEDDFNADELADIRNRLEASLRRVFKAEGLAVFDVELEERPEVISPELRSFWGGYMVTFKVIEFSKFDSLSGDLAALRRNAVRLGAGSRIEIDISRHEFCGGKLSEDLDGCRIYVYSPEMILAEKLRAICQQMPEYGKVVKRNRAGSARARDFIDIHGIVSKFGVDVASGKNPELIRTIFTAKHVPLELLWRVGEFREFHRPDFENVRNTVKPGVFVEAFDFYFDFVLGLCARLKSHWERADASSE